MDIGRILRAAETMANLGQVVVGARAPKTTGEIRENVEPRRQDLATGMRLFGQIEARLAGVLVSALTEAFERDRAHLDLEREQIEQERKRTEELMRLELLRQAGERELAAIRGSAGVALAAWITSVVFMMVPRAALGPSALALLAAGWAQLFGALAASFAVYHHVAALLARAGYERLDAARVTNHPLTPAVSWLVVSGLACTAASVLVRLAR